MNKANKLINEQSPYLIQHAYNPVDWMPWGEQAFEKAKQEDKPAFLSIGYSTCHWCHVMAHETFEDEETADILNKDFISVKVDKEERPDVDNIYMEVCQLFTGSGGWPLSIFLDYNMRPFFAGTYFPKESFKNILYRIIGLWNSSREKLLTQAKQITDFIGREKETSYSMLQNTVNEALRFFKSRFEPDYGGFSHPPKFPTPHNLLFLLEYHKSTGDKESLFMCEKTLKSLRCGGIYDHIGGGFSRYSTDKIWLVPHFEKMLYDNALLIIAYSKCYEITKNIFYADTVKEIITYLMRDMKDSNGAFYTAEDADSDGHEGLFYTFTLKEIKDVLKEDAAEFCLYYDITLKGNFEGRNILNTIGKEILPDKKEFITNCLKKLFIYRETRKRPHRDEKILLSHNGLMVAALSISGKALRAGDIYNETYTTAAKKIVQFIDENLTDKTGKLISFYLNKPGKHQGFAEDYGFFIWGLLELYNAALDKTYLNKAIKLQDIFNIDFFDAINGGFYISGKNAERLIVRTKELYDGAVPSYNSVALNNLLELYLLTQNIKYLEQFAKTLKYFSVDLAGMPSGYIHSVQALLKLQNKLPDIKICYNSVCRPPAKNIDEFIKIFD